MVRSLSEVRNNSSPRQAELLVKDDLIHFIIGLAHKFIGDERAFGTANYHGYDKLGQSFTPSTPFPRNTSSSLPSYLNVGYIVGAEIEPHYLSLRDPTGRQGLRTDRYVDWQVGHNIANASSMLQGTAIH
ncbi:unnamed protein product [Haemonchus placei]|uniref:Porin n=1 Tax=Haemonchus placei TaxID=6290 RepID=A0A0N4WLF5_HAEPC|nr:unnamed protein product [Haemonchus placei]